MIKIEMSFESGAQAREEITALLFGGAEDLGISGNFVLSESELRALSPKQTAAEFAEAEEPATAEGLPADAQSTAEPAKRTRRTKAQIAADEAEALRLVQAQIDGAEPATDAASEANEIGEGHAGAMLEADEGEDPNTPPSAIYAHRAAEYLAANPGTTPLQHMKAELTKVNDKFGLDEVRKLMVDFGIPRIGEVPVEKYPALLAVIDKRLEA